MRNKLIAPFAIVLLITPMLACALLRPGASYKWHLVLELDPSVPNREAATAETVEVLNDRLEGFGVIGCKVAIVGAPKDVWKRVRTKKPLVRHTSVCRDSRRTQLTSQLDVSASHDKLKCVGHKIT